MATPVGDVSMCERAREFQVQCVWGCHRGRPARDFGGIPGSIALIRESILGLDSWAHDRETMLGEAPCIHPREPCETHLRACRQRADPMSIVDGG